DRLKTVLSDGGVRAAFVYAVPPGEGSKTMRWYEKVLTWLLDHGVNRSSVLFAVGGGVVGDLGGFAAATVLRGIPFVQAPTTLLAQVDSSVGGKTAIDMIQGKNLVGAFYQPVSVLCDSDSLKTLSDRHRRAGYAEIAKYGLIRDESFFAWLERNGQAVCALEDEPLLHAIEASCRMKADIVAEDERETDMRALLNFGHTFGHALETSCGYSEKLLHGEAVSIGMMMALKLSARLGHLNERDISRVERHLREIGLPTGLQALRGILAHDAQGLARLMYADKKAEGGSLTFILMKKIGEAFVARHVPEQDVLAVINEFMHGASV
ncbi:MAG TPA: 3-dehydroquinate synthase, partial [Micavibrio sp.]